MPRPEAERALESLEKRIGKAMTRAIADFSLLGEGDRVMVCVSGGKDSLCLLHFMKRAVRYAPFRFEIVAVHLDQGAPGFPVEAVQRHLEASGVEAHVLHRPTYDIVRSKLRPGTTACSLCSRLRRGILYDAAVRLGCNKIALGHHRDDVLATLLLNVFFVGKLKAMPPVLRSDDGRNTVIRPMVYVPEAWLAEAARRLDLPVVPCGFCSSQPDLKRQRMTALLRDLEREYDGALGTAMSALADVQGRFLLDRRLWDGTVPTDDSTDQWDLSGG